MPGPLRLETPATPDCLDRVHALLHALWDDDPSVGTRDRMSFETAVAEIAANIVEHAAAAAPTPLVLVVEVLGDRLEARFEDRGAPYRAPGDGPSGAQPADPLAEAGRGLGIVRDLVDDLDYRRDGAVNRWTVVRRRVEA